MTVQELAIKIDNTILNPNATEEDVRTHLTQSIDLGFIVVFVAPCWVKFSAGVLANSKISLGTAIGFPSGYGNAKLEEAKRATEEGARILDMVINVGWLKSGKNKQVQNEISAIVQFAKPLDVETKVIIETCYLTNDEKITACRLIEAAGADYVKTSTGFGPAGANVEDVRLLRHTAGDRLKIKASGGIRDLTQALALIEAGADRIGTSVGPAILEEAKQNF